MALVHAGEPVFRPCRNDAGINRGVAVQRVHAPAETVWKCLLDFDAYPRMVDDVCEARVIETSEDGHESKVAITVGVSFVSLTTCLHHVHSPEHGQLTWQLDETRPSSFVSNEGFWLVRPDESDPRSCIVYYSIAVELKGWVPGAYRARDRTFAHTHSASSPTCIACALCAQAGSTDSWPSKGCRGPSLG